MNLIVRCRFISSNITFKGRFLSSIAGRFCRYNIARTKLSPLHSSCLFTVHHENTANKRKGEAPKRESNGALIDKPAGRSYLEQILTEKDDEPKTTGQKVKKAAASTFYITFGVASIAALALLTFYMFREFFAFHTPQGLYNNAVKRVKKDERCQELFGHQMLTFGEESGRGRRRHIAHHKYVKDGQERLRIMFHVKGQHRIGRVHAEIVKGEGGWDYRYMVAETDGSPKEAVTLIDNR